MENKNQLEELLDGLLKTLGIEKVDTSAINFLKKFKGVALIGDINFFCIPDILNLINLNKKDGVLTLEFEESVYKLIFKKGEIVSVISDQTYERLGEWLCQRKKLTREQLNLALKKQESSSDKLGKILVENGFISARELFIETVVRAKEMIYNIFHYQKGNFYFIEGEIDWMKVIEIPGLKIQELTLEGLVKLDEWNSYLKGLPSPDTVLRKKQLFKLEVKEETHQRILDLFEGNNSFTVREICHKSQSSEKETYRIIGDLIMANLLEIIDIPGDIIIK